MLPSRAKSKSLAARARAAGGSSDGFAGVWVDVEVGIAAFVLWESVVGAEGWGGVDVDVLGEASGSSGMPIMLMVLVV